MTGSPQRAYFTSALLHPANIMATAGIVCFAMVAASPLLLAVALVVELVYLRWLPSTGWFQRAVDRQIDAAAERHRARMRDALRAQLDDGRRRRVYELEALGERVRDTRVHVRPAEAHADVDPFELIDSYMALAVAKHGYEQLLAKVSRESLSLEIQRLEDALATTSTESVGRIRERRLAIACQRASLWDRTWSEVDRIGNQLAAIEDLIELLHDHCIVAATPASASERVDGLLAEIEDQEAIRRELAGLTPGGLLGRLPSERPLV